MKSKLFIEKYFENLFILYFEYSCWIAIVMTMYVYMYSLLPLYIEVFLYVVLFK